MDYLNSNQAFKDFCRIVMKNAGKTLAEVNKAWEEFLIEEKDLSAYPMPYGYIYPTRVTEAIIDAFESSGSIYSKFNFNWGITEWTDFLFHSDDVGLGYDEGEKKEQEATLELKTISCQFIYKYITVPKKLSKINSEIGIINYILKELPERILFAIERAAIVGDPSTIDLEDRITSFEPMVQASSSYNTDVTIPTMSTTGFYNAVLKALGQIQTYGPFYLVTSMDILTQILLNEDGVSGFNLLNMMQNLGIEQIYTRSWYNSNDPNLVATVFAKNAYMVIGDGAFENYQNFILPQNKNEFLSEIYQGGALMKPKSCATIKR